MRFVLALVALALVGLGVWFALSGLESASPSAVGPGAGATPSAARTEGALPEDVASALTSPRRADAAGDEGLVGARSEV